MQALIVVLEDGHAFRLAAVVLGVCVGDVAGEDFLPEGEAARGACSCSLAKVLRGGAVCMGCSEEQLKSGFGGGCGHRRMLLSDELSVAGGLAFLVFAQQFAKRVAVVLAICMASEALCALLWKPFFVDRHVILECRCLTVSTKPSEDASFAVRSVHRVISSNYRRRSRAVVAVFVILSLVFGLPLRPLPVLRRSQKSLPTSSR